MPPKDDGINDEDEDDKVVENGCRPLLYPAPTSLLLLLLLYTFIKDDEILRLQFTTYPTECSRYGWIGIDSAVIIVYWIVVVVIVVTVAVTVTVTIVVDVVVRN